MNKSVSKILKLYFLFGFYIQTNTFDYDALANEGENFELLIVEEILFQQNLKNYHEILQ